MSYEMSMLDMELAAEFAEMETEFAEMETVREDIVIEDHSVALSVGARVGERVFNALRGKRTDFGLSPLLVNGELIKRDQQLLVEVLPMIIAAGHTTDAWLAQRLLNLGLENPEKLATKVNSFLINMDIINKRSTKEWTIIEGQPQLVKRWLLSEPMMAIRDSMVEYEKLRPLNVPAEWDRSTRVKGQSLLSHDAEIALRRQDETVLQFHPLTKPITNNYKKIARDEPMRQAESKLRELDGLDAEFASRKDAPFFLTHTCDYRGRMYARGGFISTQGGKAMKVAIRFHRSVPVTERGMAEIAVFLGRELGCKGNWKTAKDIGEKEIASPTSLLTKVVMTGPDQAVIRLDGSSNGIQWMSALLDSAEGMREVNLTGAAPRDLYTLVKDRLGLEAGWVTETVESEGMTRYERKYVSARDKAKFLVMPYSYGASMKTLASALGVTTNVVANYIEGVNKIIPIGKFLNLIKNGLDSMASVDIDNMSIDELLAVGATQKELPEEFSWALPDGFVVKHQAKAYDVVKGIGGNYSFRLFDTERVDTEAMARALAPNIIHSLDAYHARRVINACPFEVIAVHDSFGCHAENVPALRKIIMDEFKTILAEDPLNMILECLGMPKTVKPADPASITNPYMFN